MLGGGSNLRYLHVGGLVAMGFDPTGEYLLTVSHSGRGVYSTHTWERVARDPAWAYPENGHATGIGPIEGISIVVMEKDYSTDKLSLSNGKVSLVYDDGAISVSGEDV